MSTFAKILRYHLDRGTRAGGDPGQRGRRWKATEFAALIKVDERTVRRWLSAKTQPTQEELGRIERAFFGGDKYSDWRYELRRSFDDVSWWPHALDNTTRDRTQRIFEQLQGW